MNADGILIDFNRPNENLAACFEEEGDPNYDYDADTGDNDGDCDSDEEEDLPPALPGSHEALVAMRHISLTLNSQIHPQITQYIAEMKYPSIMLGAWDNFKVEVHGNLKEKGEMTEKQKKLFRYVNTVLQSPACVNRCETWWGTHTKRNYGYAIRDYVLFMAESQVENRDVDESNFEVNGIYIVKCMEWLVQQAILKTGKANLGYTKKLLTFKSALEGLQDTIALYHSSMVDDEKEKERLFCEMEKVSNLHLVKRYLGERRKLSHKLQRDNFDDKDRDNMFFDRYLPEDAMKMLSYMWNYTGLGKKKEAFEGVNASLELLLGHHLLFRGDNKRNLELSDAVYNVQDTSRGKIPILGFQLTHSKTLGPDGRPRCMGACRSKNVELCLVSAFAFSLWYRFDFKDGPLHGPRLPNFLDKKSWYPIKVLFSTSGRSSKENCAISYNHEKSLMKKCLASIGFISKKLTHLSRKSNSQGADANQISEEQIMRAGHWTTSALVKYYLSPYPFDYIHFSAGFSPFEPYFIARDIQPPRELTQLIFPWLEEWIERVESRPDQNLLDSKERDGVILKFFNMLKEFRVIIIQDLAVRYEKSPDSMYSKHEITSHPAFQAFVEEMKKHQYDTSLFPGFQECTSMILQFSAPISQAFNMVKVAVDNGFNLCVKELRQLRSYVVSIKEQCDDNEARFVVLQEKLSEIDRRENLIDQKLDLLLQRNNLLGDKTQNVLVQITEINSSLRGTTLPGMELGLLHSTVADDVLPINADVLNIKASEINEVPTVNVDDPRFSLRKNETVMELLDEWFVLTPVRLSIHKRDKMYGANWRRVKKPEYKRKRVVINFLKNMLTRIDDGNLSMRQLGWLLDRYRVASSLKLPSLIEKKLQRSNLAETVVTAIIAMWFSLPADAKRELSSLSNDTAEDDDIIDAT